MSAFELPLTISGSSSVGVARMLLGHGDADLSGDGEAVDDGDGEGEAVDAVDVELASLELARTSARLPASHSHPIVTDSYG